MPNYLVWWHPDITIIWFFVSDMVLDMHSNDYYMLAKGTKSKAARHVFLGAMHIYGEPIFLNGVIYARSTILKMVAVTVADAKLGALFMNIKEGWIIWITLAEMGHTQPPTPIHVDKITDVGIANNMIKNSTLIHLRCGTLTPVAK